MNYSNQSTQDFNQPQQSSFEEIKPKPENNLVLAIIATVLGLCSPCCIGLILGGVAIIFANQVNTKYDVGDYTGAEQAAKNSKILSYVAFGLVALNLIYVIFVFITQGSEAILEQYQGVLDR
ncbi:MULTISPECIES: CD225/dispanin family protein [unclassified Empedobacter]|uniref:CD225/dispanin family protein n=1 Tax=unclassified Empedobacter TaxID=2643773 RepID=UPI0025C69FCB|nr:MULTISPECIES: CD225/dispanin family protein [unclassified Empedobacter]